MMIDALHRTRLLPVFQVFGFSITDSDYGSAYRCSFDKAMFGLPCLQAMSNIYGQFFYFAKQNLYPAVPYTILM